MTPTDPETEAPVPGPDDTGAPGEVAAVPEPPAPAPVVTRPPGDLAACLALAVGGAFLALFGYVVALAAAMALAPTSPRLALAIGQPAGLVLPALALLLVARATGFLAPPGPRRRARPDAVAGVSIWTVAVAMLAGVAWVSALALASPDALVRSQAHLRDLMEPLFVVRGTLDIAAILLILSIVPGVCEEILFRGFLQRVLRSRFTPAIAIGVTSTLFAAFHLDVLGFPSRVLIGIALGIAYEVTGSLRLAMFLHALHNMLVMLVMPWDLSEAMAIPDRGEAWLGLAFGVPGLVVAGWFWRRSLLALARRP